MPGLGMGWEYEDILILHKEKCFRQVLMCPSDDFPFSIVPIVSYLHGHEQASQYKTLCSLHCLTRRDEQCSTSACSV